MVTTRQVHPRNFDYGTGYVVPSGRYWLGDPAVFLDRNVYEQLLNMAFNNDEDFCAGYYGDFLMTAMRTAYGDGSYFDNESNIYDVDSGLIALLPIELRSDFAQINSGKFVKFFQPVIFCKDNSSTFYLGINGNNLTIRTDNE